jgi:hypothetical protein
MRSVTYSMGVSLDGYITGPDGGFDWTAPDARSFRQHLVTKEIFMRSSSAGPTTPQGPSSVSEAPDPAETGVHRPGL